MSENNSDKPKENTETENKKKDFIRKKDLLEIITKRLFHAGLELANDAFEKLKITGDNLSFEDSLAILKLMREGMHTEISKNALDKIIKEFEEEVLKAS